jgi:competence CoiA-like predicted nuclease
MLTRLPGGSEEDLMDKIMTNQELFPEDKFTCPACDYKTDEDELCFEKQDDGSLNFICPACDEVFNLKRAPKH